MKVTYGQSLFLPCTVEGWPHATTTWTLPNGVILDKAQNIGRVSIHANGTLQLKHVATFDKGTYVCKASNSFGTATLSFPVVVTVHPPRITSTLNAITRVSRGSITLRQTGLWLTEKAALSDTSLGIVWLSASLWCMCERRHYVCVFENCLLGEIRSVTVSERLFKTEPTDDGRRWLTVERTDSADGECLQVCSVSLSLQPKWKCAE